MSNNIKKILVFIFSSLVFISCNQKHNELNEVNESNIIRKEILVNTNGTFYKDSTIFCKGNISRVIMNFSITHDENINLDKYDLLVRINNVAVYRGHFKNIFEAVVGICENFKNYSLSIYVIDTTQNKYYRWENKDVYNLNGKKKMNIKLYSRDKINSSDGVMFTLSQL